MTQDNPYIELKDGFYQIPEASINKLGNYISDIATLTETSIVEEYQFKALMNACRKLGILNSEVYDQQGFIKSFTLCDFDHRYDIRR